MERLTTEDHELIGCHGCEEKGVCYARYWCSEKKKALIELKRYEDTGLTPEQIRELKERDTAKNPVHSQFKSEMVCPVCGSTAYPCDTFCVECGQRLWDDEKP